MKSEAATMKAFFIWVDDEWGDYVHGLTVSSAKTMFMNTWSSEFDLEGWISLRPRRYPRLDNIPITADSIGEPWFPICSCPICSTHKEALSN